MTSNKDDGYYKGYCWYRAYSKGKKTVVISKFRLWLRRITFEACKTAARAVVVEIVRFILSLFLGF